MATVTVEGQVETQAEEQHKLATSVPPTSSIRDWPNEAGVSSSPLTDQFSLTNSQFQTLQEERTPIKLSITGKIPSYAAGTLYRTGPGSYKVSRDGKEDFKVSHWFDGFGHTHRFEIKEGNDGKMEVWYNSRRANDKLIESVKEKGKYGYVSFGQRVDPCIGIFGKVSSSFPESVGSAARTDEQNQMMSFFSPPKDPQLLNIAVTMHQNMPGLPASGHKDNIKSLWAATDAASFKSLDPVTLEPIGLASQKTLHPSLKGPVSCAHAQTDPITGDVYNYNLAFGRTATYRLFHTSASTGKTEILATISGNGVRPAYLHSFFMSQDYVVLCIWGAHFAGTGLGIIRNMNMLDALAPFDAKQKTRWFVVDRTGKRGLVAEFESEAGFCFHTVNCWQEGDGESLICEFAEYENLGILQSLYYENLTSEGGNAVTFREERGEGCMANMVRYRLSGISKQGKTKGVGKAERTVRIPKRQAGDLPTMNPRFRMRESRYVYSVVNRGLSTFFDGLSKVDMKTGKVLYWHNPKGHTPGEAIFVPNPEGEEEDDGVLLSVVLDGFEKKSYLICLDARTMEELGRADVECVVGFGFHGVHVG